MFGGFSVGSACARVARWDAGALAPVLLPSARNAAAGTPSTVIEWSDVLVDGDDNAGGAGAEGGGAHAAPVSVGSGGASLGGGVPPVFARGFAAVYHEEVDPDADDAGENVVPDRDMRRMLAEVRAALGAAEEEGGGTAPDAPVQVVATVPCRFSDVQRQRLKRLAALEGLECVRVINEPTAVCREFGLDREPDDDFGGGERFVVVVDMGAATFDVTVLAIEDGIFEVLSTAERTPNGGRGVQQNRGAGLGASLAPGLASIAGFAGDDDDGPGRASAFTGGHAVTAGLVELCCERFQKRHGTDISRKPRCLSRLWDACDEAKRVLDRETQVTIAVESLDGGVDFCERVTRAAQDEQCAAVYRECLQTVDEALERAVSDPMLALQNRTQVDDVVITGGCGASSLRLRTLLAEHFKGADVRVDDADPGADVARGAASFCAMLVGPGRIGEDFIGCILDVTPLSLGIETAHDRFQPITPRNCTIPCKKTLSFSNFHEHQPGALIRVFEGERPWASANNLLGTLELTRFPPGIESGEVEIEITLDIDANGILRVTAVEKLSGQQETLVIPDDKGRLSVADIERLLNAAEEKAVEDTDRKRAVDARLEMEGLSLSIERFLLSDEQVDSDARARCDECLAALNLERLEWPADDSDPESVFARGDRLVAKLDEMIQILAPVKSRLDAFRRRTDVRLLDRLPTSMPMPSMKSANKR